MSCPNYDLIGIKVDECLDNFGGVERVWIADREDWTKSASTVSAGTIVLSGAVEADNFIELEFDKNLASYTETANFTEGVGLTYTTECAIEFYKMDAAKRNAINNLAHNNKMIAIVLDSNEVAHFMGYFYKGVSVSNVVGTTGTALTDVNNYQLTIQDTTKELNYVVKADDAVLKELKGE